MASKSFFWACLVTVLFSASLIIYSFFYHYPYIGGDYSYFVPRLIEGAAFFRSNFDIQYFSRFCGGFPSYGNPQNMYFSITQLIFILVASPILGIVFNALCYYLIGVVGGYLLLQKVFRFSEPAALIGTCIFTINGYTISRIMIGQLTYLPYFLIPAILYCMLIPERGRRHRYYLICLGALLLSSFVYSGAYLVSWVFIFTFAIFSILLTPPSYSRIFKILLLAALISSSRLWAMLTLLPFNYHDYEMRISEGLLDSISAIVVMLFFPIFKSDLGKMSQGLGWWETSAMISPLIVIPIVFALARNKIKLHNRAVSVALFLIPAVILIGAYAPFAHAIGGIPVLSSFYILFRLVAVLILPLACLVAMAFDKSGWKKPNLSALIFNLCSIGIIGLSVSAIPRTKIGFIFDASDLWFVHYPIPPVTAISSTGGSEDANNLLRGEVAQRCYEPFLGYLLEGAPRFLTIGPVKQVANNSFNFFNPACFVSTNDNSCKPWDLIAASDHSNLDKFLKNRSTDWKVGETQIFANFVSAATVGILALSLLIMKLFT